MCAFHLAARFRLAGLLRLAGEGTAVAGLSHGDLGLMIGLYRETVTSVLAVRKRERLVTIEYKRLMILDKPALRAISEL